MVVYFAALDPMTLVRALPGNVAQGIDLGNYGTWSIYYVSYFGFCGFDSGWFTGDRRGSCGYVNPWRHESGTCT